MLSGILRTLITGFQMIDGVNFPSFCGSISSYFFYILKFCLRRKHFGRFLLVTPSFMKKQVVLDRANKRLISLTIRDGIDLQTLKMIWLWGDYDLSKLRRVEDLRNAYKEITSLGSIPLIIDLGGHSGMSASYFGYIYPEATIVVLEPNVENYDLALVNTKAFINVSVLNVAVGDKPGHALLRDPGLGTDGFRIDYSEKSGEVIVTDIAAILSRWPEPTYSPYIVKCDIEGSEDKLFSSNTEWVEKFPILIIELHDWLFPGMGYSKNFLRLVSSLEGDFVHSGENVFFLK